MQPLAEVTLTRPWHWGAAVLGDSLAEVPSSLSGQAVVVGDGVVSLGDADGMVVVPAPSLRTRLIVSTDEVDLTGLERVWVDLIAVDG